MESMQTAKSLLLSRGHELAVFDRGGIVLTIDYYTVKSIVAAEMTYYIHALSSFFPTFLFPLCIRYTIVSVIKL